MSISYAIMAHPTRSRLAQAVAEQLAPQKCTVVLDPEPWGVPATLRTAVRAWAAMDPQVTHHVVLQDDIVLTADFTAHIETLTRTHPDRAVSLFTDWGSRNGTVVRLAALEGRRVATAIPQYTPCQAMVMPRRLVEGFVDRASAWEDPLEPDDNVLRKFFVEQREELLLSVPNLVEHLPVRSAIGNDGQGRRAAVCHVERLPTPWFATDDTIGRYDTVAFLREARLWAYSRRSPDGVLHAPGTAAMEWHKAYVETCPQLFGFDLPAMLDGYHADLGHLATDAVHAAMALVPPQALWSLWAAGYWLARTAGPHPVRPVTDGLATAGELVRREAVRTLIPGGLFPARSHAELATDAEVLRPVLDLALARGAADHRPHPQEA
ncbi:hypothetical protein ACFUJY_32105 [Streptomyces sp. NPDC057249]|uniref:hypothetical protein n=1 Tax=Streptomyces sp. NPDC057249 TaxID=3346067 RepID=UPI003640AF33